MATYDSRQPFPAGVMAAITMNFLAHLLLAHQHDYCPLGTLLGDFAKGRVERRYRGRTLAAIRLHRAIDRFTDAHPLHRRSRNRLSEHQRRYAGVLVDLFYDHFLVRHWQRLAPLALEDFLAHTTGQLTTLTAAGLVPVPPRLTRFLAYAQRRRLWVRYGEPRVIEQAVAQMANRLRQPNDMAQGGAELRRHYRGLERDFLEFWPALEHFASRYPRQSPGR